MSDRLFTIPELRIEIVESVPNYPDTFFQYRPELASDDYRTLLSALDVLWRQLINFVPIARSSPLNVVSFKQHNPALCDKHPVKVSLEQTDVAAHSRLTKLAKAAEKAFLESDTIVRVLCA